MQPVAGNLSQNGSDDRCEVEVAYVLESKMIERRHKDRERRDDANHLCESEEVVYS